MLQWRLLYAPCPEPSSAVHHARHSWVVHLKATWQWASTVHSNLDNLEHSIPDCDIVYVMQHTTVLVVAKPFISTLCPQIAAVLTRDLNYHWTHYWCCRLPCSFWRAFRIHHSWPRWQLPYGRKLWRMNLAAELAKKNFGKWTLRQIWRKKLWQIGRVWGKNCSVNANMHHRSTRWRRGMHVLYK